jgi:hypothetical protein
MLYRSQLHGYAPYARELRSDLTEWIIRRITRKRKSVNRLFIQSNEYVFHIIYYTLYMLIMQVYHDSDRMRDFGHMSNSGQKMRLWSYIQLRSKDMTPVIYLDSSRTFRL